MQEGLSRIVFVSPNGNSAILRRKAIVDTFGQNGVELNLKRLDVQSSRQLLQYNNAKKNKNCNCNI
eukprot:995812-Amphidinium_carterae.1